MRHLKSENNPHIKTRQHGDWQVIRNLMPYIWQFKVRVIVTLLCLIAVSYTHLTLPTNREV